MCRSEIGALSFFDENTGRDLEVIVYDFKVVDPFDGSAWDCESDWDYYGYVELLNFKVFENGIEIDDYPGKLEDYVIKECLKRGEHHEEDILLFG